MATVVPIPIGQSGVAIRGMEEDMRAIEARRVGLGLQAGGNAYATASGSSVYPPGWPISTVEVGSSGAVYILYGCVANLLTYFPAVTVSIDGATPVAPLIGTASQTNFMGIHGLTAATHTFKLEVESDGTHSVTFSDPFIFVWPL